MFLKLALGGNSVQRFAGLRNENKQRVRKYHRIAVTIFAGVVHFHRDARKRFNHVLARESRMPAGSTSQNPDVLETLPRVFAEGYIFQMHAVRIERETSKDRVFDGDGLLVNFFEHE